MKGVKGYLSKDGFIDIPMIIKDGMKSKLFPGMLPDVHAIRKNDFPLLDRLGRAYLDSTATSQEPQSVKDRMHKYRSNIIRGSNHSENSKEAIEYQRMYELAKEKLGDFFNARNYHIGFTSGTTASSNFIATQFDFEKGDLLLITEMEHNSQILTARNFARKAGAEVRYIPVLPDGRLDLGYLRKVVSERKSGKVLLNLVHVSNVTGVINPVEEVREIFRETLGERGLIYLDMAQSVGHMGIDLDKYDVDFAACSSHKMYGPMGMGAVFVNKRAEKHIKNNISGGSAIDAVSKKTMAPSKSPMRFEPGTQNLEGAIEWMFAIEYLEKIGMGRIESHDSALGKYFMGELKKIKGVTIYGPREFEGKTAVITFNIGPAGLKNYVEVAKRLDSKGISVRDGCFCVHIGMSKLLGVGEEEHEEKVSKMESGISKASLALPGAVRASFAFYNTLNDAYRAVVAIRELADELPTG